MTDELLDMIWLRSGQVAEIFRTKPYVPRVWAKKQILPGEQRGGRYFWFARHDVLKALEAGGLSREQAKAVFDGSDKLLTRPEVAKLCGIDDSEVTANWARARLLVCIQLGRGGRRRYLRSSVLAYLPRSRSRVLV